MKKREQKYWFAAKRYGWGWGLPLTWQGWLSFISGLGGFLLCLAGGVELMALDGKLGGGLIVIALACLGLLLVICFQKGEPPRWRWGEKK